MFVLHKVAMGIFYITFHFMLHVTSCDGALNHISGGNLPDLDLQFWHLSLTGKRKQSKNIVRSFVNAGPFHLLTPGSLLLKTSKRARLLNRGFIHSINYFFFNSDQNIFCILFYLDLCLFYKGHN